MKSRLIIIRGNSGSGKTTTTKKLHLKMGENTMLIQQDVVRREILRVKDKANNPAIQLIEDMVKFGEKIGYDVILEGILSDKKYGDMLRKLIDQFDGKTFAYYFDISFEETLRRHMLKPNAHEFGEEEMQTWWKDKDYLGIENEKIITGDMNENYVLNMIYEDIE